VTNLRILTNTTSREEAEFDFDRSSYGMVIALLIITDGRLTSCGRAQSSVAPV